LKIGHVKMTPLTGEPVLSGVTSAVTDLVASLERRGNEARVFALKDYISSGETAAGMYIRTLLGDRALSRKLKNWTAANGIDLLHFHTALHQTLRIVRTPFLCPVVHSAHTFEPICPLCTRRLPGGDRCDREPGFDCVRAGCRSLRKYLMHDATNRRVRRLAGKHIDLVLTHNRQLEEQFAFAGLSAPVRFVPLGVDLSSFTPAARTAPSLSSGDSAESTGPALPDQSVLYVGRVRPEKGVRQLAEAMKSVLEIVPAARLAVAGSGDDLEGVRLAARNHGVENSVDFLGTVRRGKLPGLYASAAVTVVPSLWEENFGIVGVEAMSCGTPVVGSDVAGIREWLVPGVTGLLVPPGDVGALAAAITRVLTDRNLRNRMGLAARERAKEFDVDRTTGELCEVYEDLMGRAARSVE